MTRPLYWLLTILFAGLVQTKAGGLAENRFHVDLPPHPDAARLLPGSPFGINTALRPDTPDLEARLSAMQEAGIKWGRQDFT